MKWSHLRVPPDDFFHFDASYTPPSDINDGILTSSILDLPLFDEVVDIDTQLQLVDDTAIDVDNNITSAYRQNTPPPQSQRFAHSNPIDAQHCDDNILISYTDDRVPQGDVSCAAVFPPVAVTHANREPHPDEELSAEIRGLCLDDEQPAAVLEQTEAVVGDVAPVAQSQH